MERIREDVLLDIGFLLLHPRFIKAAC